MELEEGPMKDNPFFSNDLTKLKLRERKGKEEWTACAPVIFAASTTFS